MASNERTSRPATSAERDAITALKADHKAVKGLFKQFEKLKDEDDTQDEKASLVRQICNELIIHTAIEEEIFYPAVREQIDDPDLMDEALVEHAGAKELIAQLQEMTPEDDLYDAKVTVLGEQIDHHVAEEEGDMFPKARKAKVDTEALGERMSQRRAELKAELADEDEEESEGKVRSTPGARKSAGEKHLR
jgi:hemerythrin superfamily protein